MHAVFVIVYLFNLGAGDGMVTQKMAKFYSEVHTTEMSTTMIWRLQEKGYKYVWIHLS